MSTQPVRVAIVGAGMSGIAMAHALQAAGHDEFVLFESGTDVGGTWRDNRYPGLTCDVPSHLYAYSWALDASWKRRFATGAEIHAYLRRVATDHGILAHVRFGTTVELATWTGDRWALELSDGDRHEAEVLVGATGTLRVPRTPDLPGLDTFAGPVFHSARWDADAVVDGTRVGVVGTGSTGIQIVTALADRASAVTHFQRTPQWMVPMRNLPNPWPLRWALRTVPGALRGLHKLQGAVFDYSAGALVKPGLRRTAANVVVRANLRRIKDERLRERLTPTDQPMCKRLVVSRGYYDAVQRDTVTVADAPIEAVEPTGVRTADGRLHELDVLVLATGFHAHAYLAPMAVTGEDGVTLQSAWSGGPHAHRTVALPGFPNLFFLIGPGSPVGNTSLVPIAEAQAGFVVRCVETLADGGGALAPTPAASDAFDERIRAGMPGTVWVTGCDSWYLDASGRPVLWPFTPAAFRADLARGPGPDFARR